MIMNTLRQVLLLLVVLLSHPWAWVNADESDAPLSTQTLEQQLVREGATALAQAARDQGDPVRGAVLFYQPYLACAKCHEPTGQAPRLGPNLAQLGDMSSDEHLIESVLQPSKVIRKGYESVTVTTLDGTIRTGLLAEDRPDRLVLREAARDFAPVTIAKKDLDTRWQSKVSLMPAGQANQLATRQQFLDLARYLIEVNEQGPTRAAELRPQQILQARIEPPEYEQDIDHPGMIADLDRASLKRGAEIYARTCANCHGTKDQPGSMPTSRRFGEGMLKNGSDPYSMYRTLTYGFGLMPAQTWLVPQQKYDVIHYIRETYLKRHNRSQYFAVQDRYLQRLPKGKTRGPKPSKLRPWVVMDYGPSLNNTYEISRNGSNFAYKGIAVRLDEGPGGISRGRYWMVYDHDTLRAAAGWSGEGFIDWQGIHFDGRHQAHPHVAGQVHWTTPAGPGWGRPHGQSFDDPRLQGLDGKHYGPLPRDWVHYRGQYRFGNKVILDYTVGSTEVLEMPGLMATRPTPVFTRSFNLGSRAEELVLQVAQQTAAKPTLKTRQTPEAGVVAIVGVANTAEQAAAASKPLKFNGSTLVEIKKPDDFDLSGRDFTIAARIKTRRGGTVFAKTDAGPEWVPDAKALFVRGGRLVYDIGWVGSVDSKVRVADGRWHDVALTWDHETGRVALFVDGKADSVSTLKPKGAAEDQVVRLGYAAPDFPNPSGFRGQMAEVRFYQRALGADELAAGFDRLPEQDQSLVGRWQFEDVEGEVVADRVAGKHPGRVRTGKADKPLPSGVLIAGVAPAVEGVHWKLGAKGELRLQLPAGEDPLKFTVWLSRADSVAAVDEQIAAVGDKSMAIDLAPLTRGGATQWASVLRTPVLAGETNSPFVVDTLTLPQSNPWSCQIRASGLDFYPDGKQLALCTWDGDVWRVGGIDGGQELTWRRIASGLFQPLGLKIVDGQIYVSCRDQIVILRDLDGDGETDFYENFNNDHQVTEHFHEFAMGLQTDAKGNFYYAKGARHAKKPLVPHHGTLLRVSPDGSQTEILANGFRAPNGVCVNPDGSFYLTDQEGHWTPKNRINHVKVGGFYGNAWSYRDSEDTSDASMELPVCWITNRMDRSPAEILRVPEDTWGPLAGSLLSLSYGYGKVFVVPHETVNGQAQGGVSALPIPQFPTGVMRGRFHPANEQLYLCGLFAWAGNQQKPGGLYRMRYTGQPVWVPLALKARQGEVEIRFSGPLDAKAAAQVGNYQVKVWDLKRSANYGSKHLNERPLQVREARLLADSSTVLLKLPDLEPTWGMEIQHQIKTKDGKPLDGTIHNSIYQLPE